MDSTLCSVDDLNCSPAIALLRKGLQQSFAYFPEEQTHHENYEQQKKRRQQPTMDKVRLDKELVFAMRALELHSRVKILDAQRESNNRSLMLAAAGVAVLVGGAAATAAETRVASNAGILIAVFGGLAEIFGLFAFVKSA